MNNQHTPKPHADRDHSEPQNLGTSPGLGARAEQLEADRGTADVPIVWHSSFDPLSRTVAGLDHVHSPEGACLKNRFGARCATPALPVSGAAREATEAQVQAATTGLLS